MWIEYASDVADTIKLGNRKCPLVVWHLRASWTITERETNRNLLKCYMGIAYPLLWFFNCDERY